MPKSNKKPEPIPQHFPNLTEAADFWDSHDVTDYWELTREASFEVDIQRRVFLTALEPELAKKLTSLLPISRESRQRRLSTCG